MENFEQQTPPPTAPQGDGKTTAIVANLTWIGLVVALVMNSNAKSSLGTFHIRQSIGIMLTGIASSFVAIIPFLGWIVALVGAILVLVMWITSFLNALSGKEKGALFLGDKFDVWFAAIK